MIGEPREGAMRLSIVTAVMLALLAPARAETDTVRVSQQYGLGYATMMVMERQQLIERQAAAAGLGAVHVEWQRAGGPTAQMEAIIAGQSDFIGPGVPTLATMWDRTAGTPQEVRALSALQSMPYVLVTRNPAVHEIADFTERDRIALPGVKLTGHALALEMAAAKQWGAAGYDKLDPLTVTLAHPDAAGALLSGRSEITAHFASSPFYYQELATPGFHQVLKSYDVVGGKHTNGVLITSKRFHDTNPKTCAAVLAALETASAFVKAHPRETAEIYIAASGDKSTLDAMTTMIADPDVDYTTTPVNVMQFVNFMHQVGRLKHRPDSWKDLFFPEAHGLPGS
jgi:NitT/TauT family transport system substrate-binding protein